MAGSSSAPFAIIQPLTSMRSQASTCAYGLPSQPPAFMFQRRPDAFRAAPKRKLRRDDDANEQTRAPATAGRVVIDEFGNRVLVDGLKRMRVSSPPTLPTKLDDDAMDNTDSDSDASSIVPVAGAKIPTLVGAAKHAANQNAAVPVLDAETDPSCRAMVLFNPHQNLSVERSPRIQLVSESENDTSSDSELEEPFVRFEELPDDYEEEPEAMELD